MREFKNSGFLSLIFFASYCFTYTFSLQPDLSDPNRGLPHDEKVSHRSERDDDIKRDVALKVNNLNDTHQQLIIHWVGEGSPIIICLARDSKEVSRRTKVPSAVYYSYDYGETFENKTDLFKMPNGTFVQFDKFYIHTKFPSQTIFTDSTNKMIFITEDHGRSFRSHSLTFVPNEVSILPSSLKIFLIHDKTDFYKRLYITQDFGYTWTLLQEYVRSYEWFSEDNSDRKQLIVQREGHNGTAIIKLKSSSWLFSKIQTEVLMNSVVEMTVKGDYIFAVKNNTDNGSISSPNKDLFIKYKSGPFTKASFASVLARKDFFIADITENRVMVVVNHAPTLANLYVSDIIIERTTEINFSLSLERIFCYFPNSTWKASLISSVADSTFVDLHKVEGLRGIYIASYVLPTNTSAITPEHLASRITFNWGVTWRPLNLTDKQASESNCMPAEECSLHLSQKFTLLYPGIRQNPILSSKSAPGIIIATGVYGKQMKGVPSVYMSRDGGVTFKQVLKENMYFNMGDHGGIIVAVKTSLKQRDNTSYIMYSTDMGENWQYSKLYDTPLRVYSLMTEPGENTTVFSLFASPPGNEHHWIIIKADFQKVFSYNCTEDDFKTWTPYNPDEQKMNCVLGRREVYRRRRPNSKCYTGIINYHPIEADICPCDRTDYICDEGFYWEAVTEHCIRNKTLPDAHYAVPKNCTPLTYFQRTKGYKKIPGDVCEGGLREYEYDLIPCPLREHRDFLLLAQKDRIVRIPLETSKLEVLPLQSLQNVIAIEYDMRSKCLYYADIVTDVISKWCMDSASLPKTVVDSHLHSVEGMAFDWISQHLYFVDGVSAKIEVVRVDVDNSNRYRRTIINSTIGRKPRGIAVHPIAGYMFWTDWISGAPSIYRACLDGSNPTVLFTKPIVEWPNGITVDFIADRIYWVDAKGDYIASSDFFGKGFKKVIEHDSRVSHPFSVAIFKDNMYWDDWRANAIFVADKDHGLGQEMVASNLPGLMDLKIYAHSIQEGVNGCMNNTCSHMCFGLPNNQSTCACPDDLVLVDGRKCVCPGGAEPKNGACSLVQNTCAPDRFRCTDGKCLPLTNRCDGDADCSDGSDESECANTTTTCEPNSFRCETGKCIAASWRCDHDVDCPDRSDEKECVYPVCKAGQFMCDNGRCISTKWRCDFENDCRDGSDERNCTINPMSQCMLPDEHKCPGGRNSPCIPSSWICDNEPDCPDGSDERNCTLNQCEENRFQCTTTKKCIFWMWKCDGEDDCDDNSDEMNCPTPTNRTILPFVPSPPPSFSCDSTHATFQCKDKTCIPLAWKCDRVPDCDDGSDEIGCGFNIPIEPKEKSSNKTTDYVCKLLDFTCSSGECVPRAYVCDRELDCKDGSDEKYCNGVTGCKTDGSQFRCRRTGTCIDSHLICNGHKDCMDGSDEGVCDSSTSNATVAACPYGFFRCDQFRCEPLYKKCDGLQKDCVDESDEQYCTARDRTYQATQLVVEKTFDEAVLFTWLVKPATISSLEYLPSISRADSTSWMNTSWIDFTFYRFDELEPYSTYNVTVYVRDTASNKTFPPAFYLKFTSGRGVPSPPREVNAKISSILSNYAQIEVTWLPPIKPNGEIKQYLVHVEPPQPATTVIVAGNSRRAVLNITLMNSVVEYKITVTAKNELFESALSAAFTITVADRGLKKVADLRADSPTDYSMTLKWRPQKPNLNYTIDVSTSYSQLNVYPPYESHTTKETQFTVSGLSPGVRYVFLVYAVDGNVVSEGARVQGSTIGTELPLVSNLSVATDDTKSKNVILNWSPVKDDKGKEKYAYGVYYGVSKTDLYTGAKNITNSTNIRLYDLAACTSYLFDVGVVLLSSSYAIPGPLGHPAHFLTDIDVRAPPTLVRILPSVSTSEPNITILWSASCHVVNRPVAYVIRIVEINTKEANEINVDASTDLNFKRTFTAKFGCVYNISVATSTQRTKEEWMQFETRRIPPPAGLFVNYMIRNSAMVFWTVDSLDVSLQNTNYSYEIQVCEGDKMDVDAAKTYNTSSRSIEIKDLNWRAGQSYAFAVRVVMPDGRKSDWSRVFVKTIPMINEVEAPSAKKEEEQDGEGVTSSFMWFSIIFVALVGSAAGFLYWKRKRSHINSFKNLANSHYNTRSGSTTFSGVNGLDLDDTPEIREHFSDDEPLVIA